MLDKLITFKEHVKQAASNPNFVHHEWFVKWHLEVVEKIAGELMTHHPEADKVMVEVLVWMHDYGKILDFSNQYEKTIEAGTPKLLELGFPVEFVRLAMSNVEVLDKKMELDLGKAYIEVQIVSSADGLAHLMGPFMYLWWQENSGKSHEELMDDTKKKAIKDMTRKIVLPEARAVAEPRYKFLLEQMGDLPEKIV